MNEREEHGATVIELMLREPEIVAWLAGDPEERTNAPADEHDEPPAAA